MTKCNGYDAVQSMGSYLTHDAIVHRECPELERREGHRPGGGLGYPETWSKRCPACNNTGAQIGDHEVVCEHVWKFNMLAVTGAVGIQCPHGYDACPRCDNYCEKCGLSKTEAWVG